MFYVATSFERYQFEIFNTLSSNFEIKLKVDFIVTNNISFLFYDWKHFTTDNEYKSKFVISQLTRASTVTNKMFCLCKKNAYNKF